MIDAPVVLLCAPAGVTGVLVGVGLPKELDDFARLVGRPRHGVRHEPKPRRIGLVRLAHGQIGRHRRRHEPDSGRRQYYDRRRTHIGQRLESLPERRRRLAVDHAVDRDRGERFPTLCESGLMVFGDVDALAPRTVPTCPITPGTSRFVSTRRVPWMDVHVEPVDLRESRHGSRMRDSTDCHFA